MARLRIPLVQVLQDGFVGVLPEVQVANLVEVAVQVRGPVVLPLAPHQLQARRLVGGQQRLQLLAGARAEEEVEIQRAAVIGFPRLRPTRRPRDNPGGRQGAAGVRASACWTRTDARRPATSLPQ